MHFTLAGCAGDVRVPNAISAPQRFGQLRRVASTRSPSHTKSMCTLCMAIALVMIAAPAHAVYKCTTPQGVIYQQTPCAEGVQTKPKLTDSKGLDTREGIKKDANSKSESTSGYYDRDRFTSTDNVPKAESTADIIEKNKWSRPSDIRAMEGGRYGGPLPAKNARK
jgi:hypothetical protein